MSITIAPLEVKQCQDIDVYSGVNEKVQDLTDRSRPVTYWGIYLGDEPISYTSSRERAEITKDWIEKWLRNKN